MSDRTILGVLKDYRHEWGIIFSGLSINKMIEYLIAGIATGTIQWEIVSGHGIFAVGIIILWALSDKYSIEENEDAKIIG